MDIVYLITNLNQMRFRKGPNSPDMPWPQFKGLPKQYYPQDYNYIDVIPFCISLPKNWYYPWSIYL